MKNNKGFSLVELIIAIAIMAIAGVAVFGFMSYSSRFYSRANKDVKLQYEQQIAVNQIRDIILETSKGIAYNKATDPNTMYIFSQNTDETEAAAYPVIVHRIRYDGPAMGGAEPSTDGSEDSDAPTRFGKLYMGEAKLPAGTKLSDFVDETDESGVVTTPATVSFPTEALLAENVKEFSADLSKIKKKKITLKFVFAMDEKEVTTEPVIALRNKITLVDDDDSLEEVFEKFTNVITSYIDSIVISRVGGETFAQGATDTIAVASKNVSVAYKATVKVKKNSKYDYSAVEWSVTDFTYAGAAPASDDTVTVTADGVVRIKPETKVKTFKLTATSVVEPSKSASVTINLDTNGKYPVKVELVEYTGKVNNTTYPSTGNGSKTYYLLPKVTYEYKDGHKETANDTNITTTMKCTLTKLNDATEYSSKNALAKGAGLDPESGRFVAIRTDDEKTNMEGKTYIIHCEVYARGMEGEVISCDYPLKVSGIPKSSGNMILSVNQAGLRADKQGISMSWSNDEKNSTPPPFRFYDIDWKLTPTGDGWGGNTNNKFSSNVWFMSNNNNITNGDQACTSSQQYRYENVYISPNLDWKKEFTFTVTAVAKEKKQAGEIAWWNGNGYTGNEVTAIKTVTIQPVSITLVPDSTIKIIDRDSRWRDMVGTISDSYNLSAAYKYNDHNNIYKTYTIAEAKGISINSGTVKEIFGINDNFGQAGTNNSSINFDSDVIKSSVFTPLYYDAAKQKYMQYSGNQYQSKTIGTSNGANSMIGLDDYYNFYVGIRVTPSNWVGTGKTYNSPLMGRLRYECILKQKNSNSNSVICNFKCKDLSNNKDTITPYIEYSVSKN